MGSSVKAPVASGQWVNGRRGRGRWPTGWRTRAAREGQTWLSLSLSPGTDGGARRCRASLTWLSGYGPRARSTVPLGWLCVRPKSRCAALRAWQSFVRLRFVAFNGIASAGCRECPLPPFSHLFQVVLSRALLAVPPLICPTRMIRRSDRPKKRIPLKSPGNVNWHASRNREIGGRTNLSALVWPCLAQVFHPSHR